MMDAAVVMDGGVDFGYRGCVNAVRDGRMALLEKPSVCNSKRKSRTNGSDEALIVISVLWLV